MIDNHSIYFFVVISKMGVNSVPGIRGPVLRELFYQDFFTGIFYYLAGPDLTALPGFNLAIDFYQ
jgi:hypothetical protein